MSQYKDKPRETLSKFTCKCSKCQGTITKGSSCIVNPKTKTAHHVICKK
jgi:hypothetical protein